MPVNLTQFILISSSVLIVASNVFDCLLKGFRFLFGRYVVCHKSRPIMLMYQRLNVESKVTLDDWWYC